MIIRSARFYNCDATVRKVSVDLSIMVMDNGLISVEFEQKNKSWLYGDDYMFTVAFYQEVEENKEKEGAAEVEVEEKEAEQVKQSNLARKVICHFKTQDHLIAKAKEVTVIRLEKRFKDLARVRKITGVQRITIKRDAEFWDSEYWNDGLEENITELV